MGEKKCRCKHLRKIATGRRGKGEVVTIIAQGMHKGEEEIESIPTDEFRCDCCGRLFYYPVRLEPNYAEEDFSYAALEI